MKSAILVVFLLVLLLNINCKDSSTNPNPASPISVLMDVSFSDQGTPSLAGWQDGYPIWGSRKATVSFSNDVPPSGGKWSLRVSPPDSFASAMRYVVRPEQPSQSKQFRLICWHKSSLSATCDVFIEACAGSYQYVEAFLNTESTGWSEDTTIYRSNSRSIDSLVVFVSMFATSAVIDTSKFILFNRFRLEEY
jgi:hypothetical protein